MNRIQQILPEDRGFYPKDHKRPTNKAINRKTIPQQLFFILAKIVLFFVDYYEEKRRNPIFNFFVFAAGGIMFSVWCTQFSDISTAWPVYLLSFFLVPAVYVVTLIGELVLCVLYVLYCLFRKAIRKIAKFLQYIEYLIA